MIGVGATDEIRTRSESSSNIVRRVTGEQAGVYLDDTTPHDSHFVTLAIQKYLPLGLQVFCAVAPTPNGEHGRHHRPSPPCRNMIEICPDHAGVPADVFIPFRRDYGDIIVQHAFPGILSQSGEIKPGEVIPPPTPKRRHELLEMAFSAVRFDRDRVWLF